MFKSLIGSFKAAVMAILIGLLLISLAIWGVSDAFTPNSSDAAVMVGKEKVKLTKFYNAFQSKLREENEKLPERLTSEQWVGRGLHRTVANQMATDTLIRIDADNLGLDINQADARRYVEEIGVFNNAITGKYDETKVREILGRLNRNMSVKEFEADIYDQMRNQQAIGTLLSGIVAPQEFADQRYKFMTEQRKVKLLELTRAAVTKPADPTEDELKAYVEDNIGRYTAPEYRRFTLIWLDPVSILPDMTASEEEIKDLFEYKISAGLLGREETRSLRVFVSPDETAANTVTEAIRAGTPLADIPTQFATEAPISYDDIKVGGTTDTVVSDAGFEMDEGETRTVEGSFGTWYSVHVTNITKADVPDIEAQRESLIQEIKDNSAAQIVYDAQSLIQDSLDDGSSLEDAALAHDLPVASYDFVSRIGNSRDGESLRGFEGAEGVASDDKILTEIFVSDIGFEGDVFETSNKGLAAVRVDEVLESKAKPFDEVREEALKHWHVEKANEALGDLMDSLADRANAGETLDALAIEIGDGASVRESIMMRMSMDEGLSESVNLRLLEAREGQIIRGVGANGLDRIVGKVETIMPNEDVLMGQISDVIKGQAAEQINADISVAFRSALSREYPITMLEENMRSTLGIDTQ